MRSYKGVFLMRALLILKWILDTNCLENIILIAVSLFNSKIVILFNHRTSLVSKLLMRIFCNNYLLVTLFKTNGPVTQMGPISGTTPFLLVKETGKLQVLGLRGWYLVFKGMYEVPSHARQEDRAPLVYIIERNHL